MVVYWCLMDGPVCIHLRLVGTCMSPNQPDNKSVRRRDAPGVVLEEELADLRLERPEAHAVLRLLLVVGVFVWICWLVGGGVCVRLISKGLSREGRLGGDRTIYWSQPTRPQPPPPTPPPKKTTPTTTTYVHAPAAGLQPVDEGRGREQPQRHHAGPPAAAPLLCMLM